MRHSFVLSGYLDFIEPCTVHTPYNFQLTNTGKRRLVKHLVKLIEANASVSIMTRV